MLVSDLTLEKIVSAISQLAIVATLIVLALSTHDPIVVGALIGAVSVGGGHALSASLRRPKVPPARLPRTSAAGAPSPAPAARRGPPP